MELVEGYINHIRYHNENNGYTVMEVETTHGDEILVGNFHYISEGEYIKAWGDPIDHPTHGPQYVIQKYEIAEPEDKAAMERYLASGVIKGIGPALAKRIIKKFKGDSFDIIDKEPERLAEIKGISLKKAMDIAIQFQEKQGMRHAMMFLGEYGISNHLAVKIFEEYGDQMYEILKVNPYKLAEDIQGIGFKIADAIAAKAGIALDSEYRIRAAIVYVLGQAVNGGHVYLPEDRLSYTSSQMLGMPEEFISEHISNMIFDKKLLYKEKDSQRQIYLPHYYYMELNVAKMLRELDVSFDASLEEIDRRIDVLQEENEITLDEQQRFAVSKAMTEGLMVVTGGPGTGKTTTINLMIQCFEMEDCEIVLAAPTGRASKRMTEATGYEAKTIHRLLELNGGIDEDSGYHFEKNEENPIEADVIIVDEMSMVDINLMYALLKAVIPGTRLILVGDANQLPSVGPGNVLKDIIESSSFPVVQLQHIYRQSEKSQIIVNAHAINNGQEIDLAGKSKDFYFFEKDNIRAVTAGVIYLVRELIPTYLKEDPYNVQVLTPMRKGDLGVESLNQILQQFLNPASPSKVEKETKNGLYREGDKVMQIKNNYKTEWKILNHQGYSVEEGLGVFNGDIGIIKEINSYTEKVTVLFDDERTVEYTYSMLDELELAYAITIHKSQGSEYPAVVLPLLTGPAVLCNRNLLYTAVTRAQKCVAIIGKETMVNNMIHNEMEQKRYSGLADCLRD